MTAINSSTGECPQNLAALKHLVGGELGASHWVTVDQTQIDAFADCTGDRQWIHVDVERARRESPFGSTIAHGYLVLAMIAPASFEVWIKRLGAPHVLNYGLEKVRFVAPVRAGTRLRDRIKLLAVDDRGDGKWLIKAEHTLEIEGGDKPAAVATTLTMVTT